MINRLSIINELGSAADLLLESDDWLDNQRKRLATELTKLSGEFDTVLRAIKFKKAIQQNNSVAVRIIERDEFGSAIDVSLRIMPIAEALRVLGGTRYDTTDVANDETHRSVWSLDGYDVQSAECLTRIG